MANEWTKVDLYGANNDGNPIRFEIGDGDSVSKGQLLALRDERIASAALVGDTVYAGVAAEDHLPNVGVTSISVWTDGIFNAFTSGAIILGRWFTGAEANEIKQINNVTASGAVMENMGAAILGTCLATAGDNALVNVRLKSL